MLRNSRHTRYHVGTYATQLSCSHALQNHILSTSRSSAFPTQGAIFTDRSTSLTFEGVTYFVGNTVVNKSDGGESI